MVRSGFSPSSHEKPCAYSKCKRMFTPTRPLQAVCSLRCAKASATAKRKEQETAERASDKARKEALKTIADRIAEVQTEFNGFIRARDKDKGCFVCHRPFNQNVRGQALHAGHVRSRGAAGHLRFNEDNCHGECEGCNGPHGAKPHEIEAGAIERIGQERYDALKNDNQPHKWEHQELIALKAEFRARRKQLEGAGQ